MRPVRGFEFETPDLEAQNGVYIDEYFTLGINSQSNDF